MAVSDTPNHESADRSPPLPRAFRRAPRNRSLNTTSSVALWATFSPSAFVPRICGQHGGQAVDNRLRPASAKGNLAPPNNWALLARQGKALPPGQEPGFRDAQRIDAVEGPYLPAFRQTMGAETNPVGAIPSACIHAHSTSPARLTTPARVRRGLVPFCAIAQTSSGLPIHRSWAGPYPIAEFAPRAD
jgi:hypothetical protein